MNRVAAQYRSRRADLDRVSWDHLLPCDGPLWAFPPEKCGRPVEHDGHAVLEANQRRGTVSIGRSPTRGSSSDEGQRFAVSNDSVRLKNGITFSWKRTATWLVCVPA